MKKALDLQLLIGYIKQNWFTMGIILFVLMMFIRKDMSFQLNLNTPNQLETPIPEKPTKKAQEKKAEAPSALTEATVVKQPTKIEELSVGKSITETFKSFKYKNELHNVDEATKRAYLKRFARVAVAERDKYDIPASIILASAMFHSYAGTRDMAGKEGNNHFAIPCTDDWLDSRGYYQGECYRHFENAWTSFRSHSLYITSGKYAGMNKLGKKDYPTWAKELERKGYSDFNELADNLVKIIKEYNLHELDQ